VKEVALSSRSRSGFLPDLRRENREYWNAVSAVGGGSLAEMNDENSGFQRAKIRPRYERGKTKIESVAAAQRIKRGTS